MRAGKPCCVGSGAPLRLCATRISGDCLTSETGRLSVCDYVSVHDACTILNPGIVEGQRRGGFAHGLGGALYEQLGYSPEGVPAAETLFEYTCPTAADMPELRLGEVETASPLTPLGGHTAWYCVFTTRTSEPSGL